MRFKSFNKIVLAGTMLLLLALALAIWGVDPYFHYRKPLNVAGYQLNNERYQNDGIVRHFEYDAIITGSSMTENFKTSECNEIFGVNAIKVPFSGGYFKEVNENLIQAFESNNSIKLVIRSVDIWGGEYLLGDKDARNEAYDYPSYLYDNNPFNDVSYLLNKEIFLVAMEGLSLQGKGERNICFDNYANWSAKSAFGKEEVLAVYTRLDTKLDDIYLEEEEKISIRENLKYNIINVAEQHPDTVFYLFFPPYSICYWDTINMSGELNYIIEAEKIAIEEMLLHDNIKIFSFANKFEWVCDLENYRDRLHYGEWINSAILRYMGEGKYQLTEDNYLDYINRIKKFYSNYDYESIYS